MGYGVYTALPSIYQAFQYEAETLDERSANDSPMLEEQKEE